MRFRIFFAELTVDATRRRWYPDDVPEVFARNVMLDLKHVTQVVDDTKGIHSMTPKS